MARPPVARGEVAPVSDEHVGQAEPVPEPVQLGQGRFSRGAMAVPGLRIGSGDYEGAGRRSD